MKTLLTGASGFLGQFIYRELIRNGEVITVSRTGDINLDLRTQIPIVPAVDLVVHCAGKAHSIPKTELEKQVFFDVNLKGTSNLLEGLQRSSNLPSLFVFVSTVAVYGCESGQMISENWPLNAKDPYGLSKINAEYLVQDWCIKNNVVCTILRLPLLVGENPPGNLKSMITGIKKGYYFNIAGGKARKSMVLATDVAKLIQIVASRGGVYNLTDGTHPSFSELSNTIAIQLGKSKPINIPLWVAKLMARFGDLLGENVPINSCKLNKITSDLTFDDSKARILLDWEPTPVLNSQIF